MGERRRKRDRVREKLTFLPHLFTLGNAVCGFAAVVKLSMLQFDATGGAIVNTANLWQAGALIVLAMVFDALDGGVARLVRSAGDFGGQLDSLSDAVSFGVAPALAVVVTNTVLFTGPFWGKMAWCFAAVFASATLLRLARFNVENAHDASDHQSFKGLPSPGAAGVVASLLVFIHYLQIPRGERVRAFLDGLVGGDSSAMLTWALPFIAVGLAYLMVSNVPYVHPASRGLRWLRHSDRRRGLRGPSTRTALIVAAVIVILAWPEVFAASLFCGFAASGPLVLAGKGLGLWGRKRPKGSPKGSSSPRPAPAKDDDVS